MKIHGTAKGGAISKKDFGVAFGGDAVVEVCATTLAWDESSTAEMAALYAGNLRTIQGAIIKDGSDFEDQNLKTATFYIKKQGTPEGTIYCKLYTSAVVDPAASLGSVIETSSNYYQMDDAEWSDGDHEFTFSGDNDISVGNALVIFCTFTGGSSETDYIVCVCRFDTDDNTESMRQYQKGDEDAKWEGQANINPRFKVCNT